MHPRSPRPLRYSPAKHPQLRAITAIIGCASNVACTLFYLLNTPAASVREGLLLGAIWLAISIAIDLPLMLSPPIRMSLLDYMADIGLTYLMIPLLTTSLAAARRMQTN
jgi:hypothetical protein